MRRLVATAIGLMAATIAYAATKDDIRGLRLGTTLRDAYQICTKAGPYDDRCVLPDGTYLTFWTTSKGRIYHISYHFQSTESVDAIAASVTKEYGVKPTKEYRWGFGNFWTWKLSATATLTMNDVGSPMLGGKFDRSLMLEDEALKAADDDPTLPAPRF